MLRNYFFFVIFICVFLSCQKDKGNSIENLQKSIVERFEKHNGTFALVFIDLQDKQEIRINEYHRFHAASTMKTPVMIEAYKQAKAGLINLHDSIIVKNEFSSIVDGSSYQMEIGDDSDDDLYNQIGKNKTIGDLIYAMITLSSNLATNILIDILDAKKITNTMREIGADSILILRGVEDIKAYRLGLNNTTTAKDLALIFKQIALGEIIDEQSSNEIIDILSKQQHTDVIPLLLPKNVKVANKTGWITGLQHDSAIIYLPDGRKYVLVICSSDMTEFDSGKQMLGELSKLVYDYMVTKL